MNNSVQFNGSGGLLPRENVQLACLLVINSIFSYRWDWREKAIMDRMKPWRLLWLIPVQETREEAEKAVDRDRMSALNFAYGLQLETAKNLGALCKQTKAPLVFVTAEDFVSIRGFYLPNLPT